MDRAQREGDVFQGRKVREKIVALEDKTVLSTLGQSADFIVR
jgi:hypothetical protein